MPLIVPPDQYGAWPANDDSFKTVLSHPDKSELTSQCVQRELNNVRNESPDLVRPVGVQRDLF